MCDQCMRNLMKPLLAVPHHQAVLSKWYGESEGLLAKVFKAAEALGGAIIFFVSDILLVLGCLPAWTSSRITVV